MGSNLYGFSVNPNTLSEWNFECDPEATKTVLRHRNDLINDLYLFPYDNNHYLDANKIKNVFKNIKKLNSKQQMLYDVFDTFFETPKYGIADFHCIIAYLYSNQVIKNKYKISPEVELEGKMGRGALVTNLRADNISLDSYCYIIQDVNNQFVQQKLIDLILNL